MDTIINYLRFFSDASGVYISIRIIFSRYEQTAGWYLTFRSWDEQMKPLTCSAYSLVCKWRAFDFFVSVHMTCSESIKYHL